jgi:3-oxoadipate enol-lactonase
MKLAFTSKHSQEDLTGSRRVIFLGPSLGTNTKAWDAAEGFLGEDLKAIKFDLPGHGLSEPNHSDWTLTEIAKAISEEADRLELVDYSYAGTSIGGAIGIELALLDPERLSALAVLCSLPKIGTAEAWLDRADKISKMGTGALINDTPARWFSEAFMKRSPETMGEMLNALLMTDDLSYAQACRALAAFDRWNNLSEIKCPVLVINGGLDPVIPSAEVEKMVALLPIGGQIEVSGVSHQAYVEAPEVIAKHINFHVRKHR